MPFGYGVENSFHTIYRKLCDAKNLQAKKERVHELRQALEMEVIKQNLLNPLYTKVCIHETH